jgi:hypothetical protein
LQHGSKPGTWKKRVASTRSYKSRVNNWRSCDHEKNRYGDFTGTTFPSAAPYWGPAPTACPRVLRSCAPIREGETPAGIPNARCTGLRLTSCARTTGATLQTARLDNAETQGADRRTEFPVRAPKPRRCLASLNRPHRHQPELRLATREAVPQNVHGVLLATVVYVLWIRAGINHSWQRD